MVIIGAFVCLNSDIVIILSCCLAVYICHRCMSLLAIARLITSMDMTTDVTQVWSHLCKTSVVFFYGTLGWLWTWDPLGFSVIRFIFFSICWYMVRVLSCSSKFAVASPLYNTTGIVYIIFKMVYQPINQCIFHRFSSIVYSSGK